MLFVSFSGFGCWRISSQRSSGSIGRTTKTTCIVVEPFYPYYPWGYYLYAYPGYYTPAYGEVKIETHRKDLAVYIDGGYAAEIKKDKKFTLKPGVAVTVGKTTKLQVS